MLQITFDGQKYPTGTVKTFFSQSYAIVQTTIPSPSGTEDKAGIDSGILTFYKCLSLGNNGA